MKQSPMLSSWLRAATSPLFAVLVFGCADPPSPERKLSNTDPNVRAEAVLYFISRPKEAEEIIPKLVELLGDSDQVVQERASIALNRIGPVVTAPLIDASGNKDHRVRMGAIRAFGRPSPLYDRNVTAEDDQKAFPVIAKALTDEDREVRMFACESLAYVSAGAKKQSEGVRLLIRALKDSEIDVRCNATKSIGELACLASQTERAAAIGALAKLLADRKSDLRYYATSALGRIAIDDHEALPYFVSALGDTDQSVRNAVSNGLVHLGTRKKDAIPLLEKQFRDNTNPETKSDVLLAFRFVRPLPKSLVPMLVSALKEDSASIRRRAAMVLGDIGPDAKDAIPTLSKILENSSGANRVAIAGAIYDIERDHEKIIPLIVAELDHSEPSVRESAVGVLLTIGPPAQVTLKKLRDMPENDPSERVRISAKSAIRHIEEK